MKNILAAFTIFCAGGLGAQVNFPNDTVDMVLDHGLEAEGKAIITNNTSAPLDYKYNLLTDQFKGTSGWTVSMCDCKDCLVNYPDTGTCTGLPAGEFWLFSVYVTDKSTTGPAGTKYFTLALNNPNNAADADTITFRTVTGRLASVGQADRGVSMKIYPNPAQGEVSISIPYQVSSAQLILTDLSGMEIYKSQISVSTSFSTRHLPRGVYVLSVQTAQDLFINKLVLE